jgi:hypothetical protein
MESIGSKTNEDGDKTMDRSRSPADMKIGDNDKR